MARTTEEIAKDIARFRRANKKLYERMGELIMDKTLATVMAAYQQNPEEARRIHREILTNDNWIAKFSEELCG